MFIVAHLDGQNWTILPVEWTINCEVLPRKTGSRDDIRPDRGAPESRIRFERVNSSPYGAFAQGLKWTALCRARGAPCGE